MVHLPRRRLPRRHGQVKPFARPRPTAAAASRRKNLSRGVGQWNHYYVRAINGEIRLWVNGEEVSGGPTPTAHRLPLPRIGRLAGRVQRPSHP